MSDAVARSGVQLGESMGAGFGRASVTTPQARVVNAMTVASPQQVMLKVRFLEVDRDAGREIGINWAAINGSRTGVTRVWVVSPQQPPQPVPTTA